MTRTLDYPAAGTTQAFRDLELLVRSGTSYANTQWRCNTVGAITVDLTTTTWGQILQTQASLATDVQYRVDTIAALKALTTTYATVEVLGYYAAGDGGGGLFYWDAASAAADNAGTIIQPSALPATGRWKRLFSEFLNVMWFGAKGDGATDDAPAFNAAITVGGDIYAPKPTFSYRIPGTGTSQIKLLGNTRLVFEPGSTITIGTPSGFSRVLEVNTSNAATIENVTVEGNGLVITMDRTTAQVQYPININCQTAGNVLDNVRIKDVVCKDSRYDGFTIGGNASAIPTRIYMERVVCTNNYRNGASIIQCDGFYATDCVFKGTNGNSPQAGFDVEPDVGCVARNLHFTRCTFSGNVAEGLYLQKGAGNGTERGSLIDCVFEGNTGDGCKLYRVSGFKVIGCTARINTGASTDGFNVDDSDDIRMSDCLSESNGAYGIRWTSIIGGVLHHNECKGNASDGLLLANSSSDVVRGAISFNHLEGNAGRGMTISGCTDLDITHNMVARNNGDGIDITADTHHCAITHNQIIENSQSSDLGADGIIMESRSNYNNIANNVIRKCMRYSRGTATAGGAATITLPTTRVQVDDWYIGRTIRILSGTGSGQTRTVSAYVGATGVATVSVAWVAPPDATSVYEMNGPNGYRHRYGIRVSAGCTENRVVDNDLYQCAGTGNYSDAGTGTITTSGNRT